MSRTVLLVVCLACVAASQRLLAASRTDTLNVTATVSARAKLQLGSGTLSFPDADPDTTPSVTQNGGALSITAKGRTTLGSTVTLTVRASDDLKSGLDVIPINLLTWTAGGAGFVGGTMDKTTAQPVGSWISSGTWTGSQTYAVANSWSYSTGTYNTTLTYTLTAP